MTLFCSNCAGEDLESVFSCDSCCCLMPSWSFRLGDDLFNAFEVLCQGALPAATKEIQSKNQNCSHLAYCKSLFRRSPGFWDLAQMGCSAYTACFHVAQVVLCCSVTLSVCNSSLISTDCKCLLKLPK